MSCQKGDLVIRRLLTCLLLSLTLTACVTPLNPFGPRWDTLPSYGMTKDEVRARWDGPMHVSWYEAGGGVWYDSWTYEEHLLRASPYGSQEYVNVYVVHFQNDKVISVSY